MGPLSPVARFPEVTDVLSLALLEVEILGLERSCSVFIHHRRFYCQTKSPATLYWSLLVKKVEFRVTKCEGKYVYRTEQNYLQIVENAVNFALSCTLSFTFCHLKFHFITSDASLTIRHSTGYFELCTYDCQDLEDGWELEAAAERDVAETAEA